VRIFRQLAAAAVAVAGLSLAVATPASAAVTSNPAYLYETGVTHGDCDAYLLTTRWTASSPSDLTAFLQDYRASGSCSFWIQGKTTKAKAWATLSGGYVAISSPGTKYGSTVKTGAYADSPGHEIRACVKVGSSGGTYCTADVAGQSGKGTAPADPQALSYGQNAYIIDFKDNGNIGCYATLASSTTGKSAGAKVDFWAQASDSACTVTLEVSTNSGHSWTSVSESVLPKVAITATDASFSSWFADGSKHLARVCVVANAVSSKTLCSGTW
jgi:3D (Asp-Asp-Asp) domain-containing protein